nr:MAG TPA: Avd-like-generating retroelement protein [Caudoviricetes sp.]
MSGVYMRNRNLSSFEYFNTAVAIRNDVTRLVTSRDVPKSYRFIFAVPMAETARSVVFNLVKADAFYPNTSRNVDERKRYMTLALADLNQLYQDMQSLLTMGLPIKAARLEGILDRIDSDIKLIKGARAGVKLIGKG